MKTPPHIPRRTIADIRAAGNHQPLDQADASDDMVILNDRFARLEQG
jgi:hypothetical protein